MMSGVGIVPPTTVLPLHSAVSCLRHPSPPWGGGWGGLFGVSFMPSPGVRFQLDAPDSLRFESSPGRNRTPLSGGHFAPRVLRDVNCLGPASTCYDGASISCGSGPRACCQFKPEQWLHRASKVLGSNPRTPTLPLQDKPCCCSIRSHLPATPSRSASQAVRMASKKWHFPERAPRRIAGVRRRPRPSLGVNLPSRRASWYHPQQRTPHRLLSHQPVIRRPFEQRRRLSAACDKGLEGKWRRRVRGDRRKRNGGSI